MGWTLVGHDEVAISNFSSDGMILDTPAEIADGDLLVANSNSSSKDPAAPSNFVKLNYSANFNGTYSNQALFYKIWHTGDATSYEFEGNISRAVTMGVYRHEKKPIIFDTFSVKTGTSSSANANPLTTSEDDSLLVWCLNYNPSTFTSAPSGYIGVGAAAAGGGHAYQYYTVQSTKGAAGTPSGGFSASSNWTVGLIAFHPSSAAKPYFYPFIIE